MAIETTGRSGSVAVLSGERVLRQCQLDPSRRTAATLAPEIDQVFRWCEQTSRSIGFVSVADGPGSFTGLRIGVTTAKTLCYARSLPLVAVDSLAAIAAATFDRHADVESLWVAVDAYRGQVFAGQFRREGLLPALDQPLPTQWTPHPDSVRVCSAHQWASLLESKPDDVRVAGDERPLGRWADEIVARSCDAIGVGCLAVRAAIAQRWCDPLALVPRYLKVSAAEENSNR